MYGEFVSGQSTSCLFLDVQRAFDNVVPNILIGDLVILGLPPKICWFVCQLISQRSIRFVINGEISSQFFSDRGVPQESTLSPFLFNLYTSGCMRCLPADCRIVEFADDIALYVRSSNIAHALRSLERSADGLSKFLYSRGLAVSPSKSALVVFSRRRVDPLSFSVELAGETINSVRS